MHSKPRFPVLIGKVLFTKCKHSKIQNLRGQVQPNIQRSRRAWLNGAMGLWHLASTRHRPQSSNTVPGSFNTVPGSFNTVPESSNTVPGSFIAVR